MSSLSAGTSRASPDSKTPIPQTQAILKNYSCILCAQRKVKCDKAPGGCANCAKARVSCLYKPPPPPRRRKKGYRELDVNNRLKLYEDALRKLGVDPSELENMELSHLHVRKADVEDSNVADTVPSGDTKKDEKRGLEPGMLVSDEGKSRYLENGLWTVLKADFRDSKEILDDSSDEDEYETNQTSQTPSPGVGNILLNTAKSTAELRHFHPQPAQISRLWQTYLDNVNPVVKVFHAPTVQQIMLNTIGNMDDIPKNFEALMFGIYCAALNSLGNAECHAIMGETKAVVTQRFRSGAQYALGHACFLKTNDLMVLQAFVLFLVSLQDNEARIIWILTGIASRIGQRLGLHRDGLTLGLPPFEVEIRRRLWWQILFLDAHSEKLAGAGANIVMGDTKQPLNVNDSDLFRGMKEYPKEKEGATEMMFFLIRCHVGDFLRQGKYKKGNWNKTTTNATAIEVKINAIDELEAFFQQKFLQYIDTSVPWHSVCEHFAKAVICTMRFMAYSPAHHGGEPPYDIPPTDREEMFQSALRVVTYQNLASSLEHLQGYVWHVNSHFQWKAFVFMVSELRYRAEAPDSDDAWKQIRLVYDFHPNLAKEGSRRALPIAIGTLTLKAWNAYVAARGVPGDREPYFIQLLRIQSARQTSSLKERKATPTKIPLQAETAQPFMEGLGVPAYQDITTSNAGGLEDLQWNVDLANSLQDAPGPELLGTLDPEKMDWSQWNNILADFQTYDADWNATADMFNFGFEDQ